MLTSKMMRIGNMYLRQGIFSRRCISTTPTRLSAVVSDKRETVKPEYYVPRAERGSLLPFTINYQFGEERLERNDRRCPTRELNFTAEHWGKHKSPYRKLRHMVNIFRSSPVQRLAFPDLFLTASVAACLTYYNEFIHFADSVSHIEPAGFAGATTAIGILAGFRLNASYGRYEECRIFWGDTNNTIRDLGGQTMMWMKDADQQKRMMKLNKAYPVVLHFHLHAKGGHHNMKRSKPGQAPFKDRVQAEFEAELHAIYTDGKDESDFQRLADVKYNGGNTSLEVLTLMRETIAGSVGTVDAIYVRELDEQCQRLCASYGASERVLRTALPTSFTRLTSRLMFIWSNLLPFALYPAMGPFGTLPTALITSFAILAIEDIGVQLEEPFDILPLRQYSDGMFDALGQIERNYTPYVLPSLTGKV